MVPAIIQQRLSGLRWRERCVRLVWGLTRWAAFILGVLMIVCAGDWLIDLWREVPLWGHALLLFFQTSLALFLAFLLLVFPQRDRLGDRDLALFVEDKVPAFDNRLITAVELNRPDATTQGMSPALLAVVTREAEERSERESFAGLVDHARLGWGLAVVAPVLLLAVVPTLLWGDTVRALLRRQLLYPDAIPRSVQLTSETREVWPASEEVVLRFRATGPKLGHERPGLVQVKSEDLPSELYKMEFVAFDANGDALYEAKLPPGSNNFEYRAWLGDGRTRKPGKVIYEPRPAIVTQLAYLQLPSHVGRKPDGSPYEKMFAQAEVKAPRDAVVRIEAEIQKPIVRASLEILGLEGDRAGETVLSSIPMLVFNEGKAVEAILSIREGYTGYRIVVEDRYGFKNPIPPRRGITIIPEELPIVSLLPERFPAENERSAGEETEVEGMPVPLGKSIRIAYTARAANALSRAALMFRINEGTWQRFPLAEVKWTEQGGDFEPRLGVFRNTTFRDQVEFHAVESEGEIDLNFEPPRMAGGGRFDFQTSRLPGLKVGDVIEFYVEAYDRHPDHKETPGRSDGRLKTVVTVGEFSNWLNATLEQERRIKDLADKQRGIFKD